MSRVMIYDTTLRDGTQGEKVAFSADDKIKVAKLLDEFGVDYIEGGWPGSNPKDMEFFQRAQNVEFKHAKIAAFGSTRRPNLKVEEDSILNALIEAKTKVVTIFGKSWDFQVTSALNTTLEENLKMIEESIAYLKKHDLEVIYDAEHFFDAYKENPEYALETLRAAKRGGADILALCETNGGALPWEVEEIVAAVKKEIDAVLGVHTHNDGEMGVANSIMAVKAGADMVQGTINGYGERCGNANLSSIIPTIGLKMKRECLLPGSMARLTEVSRSISELANLSLNEGQPYVGKSAFAHKAGIHVSAIRKDPRTYEHLNPELVGNKRRILISELSGKSNILYKAQEFGLAEDQGVTQKVLQTVKELENQGYQFEGADASLELLMKRKAGLVKEPFALKNFRIIIERDMDGNLMSEVTIKVEVDDQIVHTAAESPEGPIDALDKALRKALESAFPELSVLHLNDYKVRVLEERAGTSAQVRVLIETGDAENTWDTVGVSHNIIEASWEALVDGIKYGILKNMPSYMVMDKGE